MAVYAELVAAPRLPLLEKRSAGLLPQPDGKIVRESLRFLG